MSINLSKLIGVGYVAAAMLIVSTLSGCADRAVAPDAVAQAGAVEGANWSSFGGDWRENHYSPLEQINDGNVSRLGLAWSYDLPVTMNGLGTPLAIDGILYFPVGHSVIHAMDARTGKLLWKYDPDVYSAARHKLRAGWPIRGVGYWEGKIFAGTLDGRLIALDAKDGSLLWTAMTVDPDDYRYITGPPWVMNGKVIIGHGGADYSPVRGYVTAYDAETGEQAWRFYTVPGNPADGFESEAMEMAAKTWTGEWWKFGGGGTVWHAMAYDQKYNRIYLGTGNASPWNQKIFSPDGGDNLFLASVVALDADTGEYIWHYQTNPGETWDYNSNMDIELAELEIDGELRDVILHAPKNGFFYVIDRKDGKLISADQFANTVTWAERIDMATGRPVENPDARYRDGKVWIGWPGQWGAHPVAAMSFSRKTGLVYIPTTESYTVYSDPPDIEGWTHPPGMRVSSGIGPTPANIPPQPPPSSYLQAWDPVAKRRVWEVPLIGMQNGATLATGGNLVFQGQVTGELSAYAADTGTKLWSFDAQVGVAAQPISYLVDGKQYITVLAGWRGTGLGGTGKEWNYYTQKRHVLTFVLDGDQTLPPFEHVEPPLLDDPNLVIDDAKAELGREVFHRNCHVCHGPRLLSGGAAPDMRRAGTPMSVESLAAVLQQGALVSRGMPQFEEMPDAEVEGLVHYIRRGAREAIAAEAAKAEAAKAAGDGADSTK
ncbi:MAG TPA: PQQ-dependent dehydrogenase, methanol/ethanol family [Xanthomonadaceae bacterium]|nr:PQQ-dependent dehydrogenase, methanol/ethanol family [Luteimonas sp.]HRQ66087.1 PQQ-dependent dehydrogenase, methanol/ethanol family [Xanthomonadaceae bacterium]